MRKSSLLGHPLDLSGEGKHHHIVGAGIAGLLLGYFLRRNGHSFTIYEKTARAGGLLGSVKRGDAIFERAANGFLWTPALQALADDLGLAVMAPGKVARARYLLRDGRMRRMPLSPLELIGALARLAWPRRAQCDTVEDFGLTYFGEKVTRQVIEPAFAGIYGGQTAELSFPAAMGALAEVQKESSWLPAALWRLRKKRREEARAHGPHPTGTHSFEGGTQTLIDGLVDHLGDHIQFNTDGLQASQGHESVILCTPAHIAKGAFAGATAERLAEIDYFPMLSVSVLVPAADLPGFKPGFGLLIPRSEGIDCLGVLFNHCIFPNRAKGDMLNLTLIFRDETGLMDERDEAILATVYNDLEQLFGGRTEAVEYAVHRWHKGIPVYSPGLHKALPEISRLLKDHYPNYRLFGNYTGEVSIRGMAEQARAIAEV